MMFINSMLAGIAISLGCWVYLITPNKIVGAFLFSCGLLAVRIYKLNLFTGKCQFILGLKNPVSYYIKVLLGNLAGVLLMTLITPAKIGAAASEIALLRQSQTFLQALAAGVGCGALMSLATYAETPLWVSSLCVAAFILGGLNHCMADAFYMLASKIISITWFGTMIGNAIGGAIFSKLLVKDG